MAARRPVINIAVNLRIMFPCAISAWAFSVAIAQLSALRDRDLDLPAMLMIGVPAMAATGYIIAWWLSYSDATPRKNPSNTRGPCASLGDPPTSAARQGFTLLLATVVSGVILGLLLFAAIHATAVAESATTIDMWHAVAFGPPLFLLALLFSVTIHIGAVRRVISEHYREWLARLGGFQLLYATVWTLIFALVLYAAPLVHWLAGGGLAALGAWAGGSGAGVWLARSPTTGGERNISLWRDAVSRVAPWLFLGGLAIIVAYATHIALMEINIGAGYVRPLVENFSVAAVCALYQLNDLSAMQILAALIVMAGLFLIIICRFDINLFSLHALYCNRLARAYLGASRAGERTPNPFTGFDVHDDVPFHELARQRPIHIVNTAINLTGGDDLAWQTRRAASFAVTPCWAGFETRSTQGHRLGAYRRTRFYAGGRNFGTWIAVSGAAASPNMGYHTSPAVAALMTAFNLRLGRWCGNPVHADVWDKTSPCNAAKPILAELTGSATAQADWVNLTDGGHFENLGVYELIRRRCRLIVVTDAGCDPEHKFEDLANLLRKCWTDLGVNIRFENFDSVKFKDEKGICKAHCAIGRIDYTPKRKTGAKDDPDAGVLIYLKASMTGDEWPDIRQYADNHQDFPHETTSDQFFDENQFESYRHLGYKIMAKTHQHIAGKAKGALPSREPRDLPVVELIDLLMPD